MMNLLKNTSNVMPHRGEPLPRCSPRLQRATDDILVPKRRIWSNLRVGLMVYPGAHTIFGLVKLVMVSVRDRRRRRRAQRSNSRRSLQYIRCNNTIRTFLGFSRFPEQRPIRSTIAIYPRPLPEIAPPSSDANTKFVVGIVWGECIVRSGSAVLRSAGGIEPRR